MFERYWGNAEVAAALERMIEAGRIPQTMLFAGPEGVGKATLARRFAARLLGGAALIEKDDLSLPEHRDTVADREKWPAERRNEEPLLFASHADFLTFAPDGPLRQISIPQMRLLKELAPYRPHHGAWRVFLIDQVDRANEQAANSLLKTLEEPPPHLILILTAENAYDLLPTIRSRAVPFAFSRLSDEEMRVFLASRQVDQPERRLALAQGCPGVAATLDLAQFDQRRAAMLALLEAASGVAPFAHWTRHAESLARNRGEKLENYLRVLYLLLRDVLLLREGGGPLGNPDLTPQLQAVARRTPFAWIRRAAARADELAELLRRNIQKSIALDALVLDLRAFARRAGGS
jgi:DNA polymerase-3 subunit delta'